MELSSKDSKAITGKVFRLIFKIIHDVLQQYQDAPI
jgi:hypothetical protein